jgi:hypothetical protein
MFMSKYLLLAFVALLSFQSLAQTETKQYKGDENYLRACIQWNDSTEYQTPIYTEGNRTVYQFKMHHLYWGIYQEKEIYVATHKVRLNKFNPERKLGRDYFWTLRRTEHAIDGKPIYIHSGNF